MIGISLSPPGFSPHTKLAFLYQLYSVVCLFFQFNFISSPGLLLFPFLLFYSNGFIFFFVILRELLQFFFCSCPACSQINLVLLILLRVFSFQARCVYLFFVRRAPCAVRRAPFFFLLLLRLRLLLFFFSPFLFFSSMGVSDFLSFLFVIVFVFSFVILFLLFVIFSSFFRLSGSSSSSSSTPSAAFTDILLVEKTTTHKKKNKHTTTRN